MNRLSVNTALNRKDLCFGSTLRLYLRAEREPVQQLLRKYQYQNNLKVLVGQPKERRRID